jgi:hypothetical protein
MLIALAGMGVHTTEKRAAHTAGYAVIIRGSFERNLGFPWLGHDNSP